MNLNANNKNLITCTRSMNTGAMLDFELYSGIESKA